MKKIMILTGSRGEWGYIRPIIKLIESREDVDYRLVVTNMHLLPSYGNTYKEIEADGFKIHYKIHMYFEGDSYYTMAKSLGVCLSSLPDIICNEKPDWILLAGDRGEQLMGAIAASYTYTPVAHIQAGEVSGNIDGMVRHAIGKLVHLHFASNEDAKERLIRLGEQSFRIYNVGAPQLDELVNAMYTPVELFEKNNFIDLRDGFILAVIHPVTEESYRAGEQAKVFIDALNEFSLPKILIMPNNDTGSQDIRKVINENKNGKYHVFDSLKREDYLGLLKECSCIVGNSSSGLLEAPSFRTPAVNIGRRQYMRYRGNNVIDVDWNKKDIIMAIRKAISKEFKAFLELNIDYPYGNGHSSEKILNILLNTKIDDKLLVKNLTY